MIYLDQYDLAILGALEDYRSRNAIELAAITELPTWTVRSCLAGLRRRGFVKRGHTIESVGKHWISAPGASQLQAQRQLRIVQ